MARAFADLVPRTLRTAEGRGESRSKLMGAVRAAARRLHLEDEDRRALQLDATGKASLADMNLAELGRVLDRLNRGWSGPAGHRAHVAKIRALWWTLYWLGEVDEPNDRAIDGFVRRQTDVSALRFLDHRRAASVVEALKSWAARAGVNWSPLPLAGGAGGGPVGPLDDRRAVLAALQARMDHRGTTRAIAAELGLPEGRARWERHELDAAIRHLGKLWRRQLGRKVAR